MPKVTGMPEPTKQMDLEWQAWVSWCKRFEEVTGDTVNGPRFQPLIDGIKRWGEELVSLRIEQGGVNEKALAEAREAAPIELGGPNNG